VKEKPNDLRSMLRMAEVYHKNGIKDSADFWLQKAFKLDPEISPAKYKKEDKPENISIYSSDGKVITLTGGSMENFMFSIKTGLNYGLVIERVRNHDDADKGGSEEILSMVDLEEDETFNFFIKKFVKVDYGRATKSTDKKSQNILGLPGDLITFQITPNSGQDTDQYITKLLYKGDEVSINGSDTIVFGYQIEELPKTTKSGENVAQLEEDVSVPFAEKSKVKAAAAATLLAAQNPVVDSTTQTPDPEPPVEVEETQLAESTPPSTGPDENVSDEEVYQDSLIQYRVQVAASKVKLSEEQLKKIYSGDLKLNYFEEDGYFKYYIAQESNYFTAKKMLDESGVKNGFIVAYEGSEKRVLSEAIAMQYKERMTKDGFDVNDTILQVITVNFNFSEFTLATEEQLQLHESVIDQLKVQNDYYVIVNGHTDVRGSDAFNYGLSEERALFVRNMIIDAGISSDRVKTFSFGESKLAKQREKKKKWDESFHQVNRRVEVILLSPEATELTESIQ
jgi:outer membrane protein OmpA-like peptidoglycan-associated protein